MKHHRHRSSLSALRSFLYSFARMLGDVSAIQHHRVGQRLARRMAGRYTSRWLRKIR